MIAVIDYDAGNLRSVQKALISLGEKPVITRNDKEIQSADRVILPGVGAFGEAMDKLKKYNLVGTIKEIITKGTPFLGICLGLQLLFDGSEENGGISGLGILEGEIKKIPDYEGLKIPHIGWNSLITKESSRLYQRIEKMPYVYFVHSYYLKAKDPTIVSAATDYGVEIHASIEKNNLFACQFHPEKSGETGLKILKNFVVLSQ